MIGTSIEALLAHRDAWLKGDSGDFVEALARARVARLAVRHDRLVAALTGMWEEKTA